MIKIYLLPDDCIIDNVIPDPANLICIAHDEEWADKIADAVAKQYGCATMMVNRDGTIYQKGE